MKRYSQKKVYVWVITLTFVLMCMGCATKQPIETGSQPPVGTEPRKPGKTKPQLPGKTEPQQEITYFEHTVKYSGETLSIIAGWYIKDIKSWKALAEANPDIDPKFIFTGNKIRIPEYLMKTHEPMPKEFVDSFYPQKPAKPIPPPPEEEEPPLFAPK
jgi:hypothetical protein